MHQSCIHVKDAIIAILTNVHTYIVLYIYDQKSKINDYTDYDIILIRPYIYTFSTMYIDYIFKPYPVYEYMYIYGSRKWIKVFNYW